MDIAGGWTEQVVRLPAATNGVWLQMRNLTAGGDLQDEAEKRGAVAEDLRRRTGGAAARVARAEARVCLAELALVRSGFSEKNGSRKLNVELREGNHT